MIYVHFRTLLDPAYESFCRVGETLDCQAAAESRFSSLAGVPLAFWGLAGAVAMAVLAGTRALLPLATAAAAVSLLLAGVSAFVLRVLCLICAASWIVDWALFALAVRWRREAVAPSRATLLRGAGLSLAIVAAGWVTAPKLAPLASWRAGMTVPHGVDAQGHPWLGAEQPRIVVEEFVDYTCPHCRTAHARLRAAVERHAGSARLVRHDFARARCAPVPKKPDVSPMCAHARLAHCALLAKRFWEASDWLFSRPEAWRRPDVGQAARAIGIPEAALRACMARRETYEAVHREYQHGQAIGLDGTPAFVVGGRRYTLAEAVAAIRAAH